MESKRKKITTAAIAGVTAVALLIGGTFAWQSISQTALNEKEAVINPGGRLHDDFNGTNKDVYVENFADDDIFARVRLNEYFEITMNRGITDAEKTEVITTGATKGDTSTYLTHKFGEDNATDDYWQWYTGGQGVYMPTFNKNKDSLVADINGTFAENYEDYDEYEVDDTKESTEIYDSDSNSVDEVRTDLDNLSPYVEAGNIKTVTATHTAKETEDGTLISMEEWLELANNGEDTANYWVYDTDGWIYWSSPIKANTATGLLLDEIELKNVMDDSYYYAIEVTGQFITADDLGKDDNTGFYADTTDENPLYTAPSKDALALLKKIGVDVGNNNSAEDDEEDKDDESKEDGDNAEERPATTFTTTDELSATPYVLFTASDSDASKYDMTFVRTNDELTENSEDCTWENKQLAKVYTLDEENAYTGSLKCAPWSDDYSESVLTVTVYNKLKPKYMNSWFSNFRICTSFELEKIDTSETLGIKAMFWFCQKVQSLDCTNWDTSKMTSMSYSFYCCSAVSKIKGIENFDTSNVQDMSYMFFNDTGLTKLDLSAWDVSSVTSMNQMFAGCQFLKTLNASDWDTSNVTDMYTMFRNCMSLTLDCSSWNVSKVTERYAREFNLNAENVTAPSWSF